jgi:hypothetical protein
MRWKGSPSMRKRQPAEGQASLFENTPRPSSAATAKPPASPRSSRVWRMPQVQGRTVAEIRLRWSKRLTPAQVARVEAALGALPGTFTKLGFGPVVVERVFVRRRRT